MTFRMEELDALDAALAEMWTDGAGTDTAAAVEGLERYPELAPLLAAARAAQVLVSVAMPTVAQDEADRQAFVALLPQRVAVGRSSDVVPGENRAENRSLVQRWLARLPESLRPAAAGRDGVTRQSNGRRQMVPVLARLALAFVLTFGSLGATMAAAADSLPGSALYPLKLAGEQVRMSVAGDPAARADLGLEQVQERCQEMVSLAQRGRAPDVPAVNRLQEQFQRALEVGANLPDEDFEPWLARTQQMAQTQSQAMERAAGMTGEQAGEALLAGSRMMNQVRQQVEAGLGDTYTLRQRLRAGMAWQSDEEPVEPAVTESSAGTCPNGDPDCVPDGDANRYGQDAEAPAAGPGQPGGNPDGPCELGDADCVPDGDANRYGQDAETPAAGPGQPGGNPDGPCDLEDPDCVPVGDAHRHRPQIEETDDGAADLTNVCVDGECVPVGDANRYGQGTDEKSPGPGEPGGNPEATCVLGDANCVCNQDGAECVPVGDANQYGPDALQPGPGEPGGNPDGDGTPAGDENQNQNGQSDDSTGSGGSGDGGGSSGGGSNSSGNGSGAGGKGGN